MRILEQQSIEGEIAREIAGREQEAGSETVDSKAAGMHRLWPLLAALGGVLILGVGFGASYFWMWGDSEENELNQIESQGSESSLEIAELDADEYEGEAYIRVQTDEEFVGLLQRDLGGDLAISLAGEEFRIPSIEIEQRNLTLAAAVGFHPTVFVSVSPNGNGLTAIQSELNLRGIAFESDFDPAEELDLDEAEAFLTLDGGSLIMQDCSIEHHASTPCLMISDANAEVTGCNVLGPRATAFVWQPSEEHLLEVNDCVVVSENHFDLIEPFGKSVRLQANTLLGRNCFECGNEEGEHSLDLTTQDNTFVCSNAMLVLYGEESDADELSLDWLRWKSVADVLPVPIMQQVLETDGDADMIRAWALMESLADFENVSTESSSQESEYWGFNTEELEALVADGKLTPEWIRRKDDQAE
ncbi:MAG: hypothetical protein ACE361_21745 [Aureliella sp.]